MTRQTCEKNRKAGKFSTTRPRSKMSKTRYEAMLRLGVSFDVKLGRTIKNNVLNTCARFRCVWHSFRAATARIVQFCSSFIGALRRDARGWDALAMRYWRKIKCFTTSNRHRHLATPRNAAMPSQSFEGVILRAITQKIGESGIVCRRIPRIKIE